MPPNKKRTFTREFKIEAVKLITEQGYSTRPPACRQGQTPRGGGVFAGVFHLAPNASLAFGWVFAQNCSANGISCLRLAVRIVT
jgi:hypothetical protein